MGKRRSGNPVAPARLLAMLIFAMAGFHGCSKDGGVCVSNSGEMRKQVREVGYFNQVNLNDNVNLILTSDSVGPLVVEAGSNLIGGIKTTVENDQLTISNTNTCNWLRDYNKPVNVYISTWKLWKIYYNASGDVTSSGTLKLDSLAVEVWGGCGTIDLAVNVWQGNFSLNLGTVDFKLRGVCAIASVYTADYGLYDGRNLSTGFTFITSTGSNNCYVMATNSLEARIESIGNIYYTGNPQAIQSTITGSGELLPF